MKKDPRISNLTPYTLVHTAPNGDKICILFTKNIAIYSDKGLEVNDWPTTLSQTFRTAIVTEDVGMWLARPENAHNWRGRVVGPVGLPLIGKKEEGAYRTVDKWVQTTQEGTEGTYHTVDKWVMYKEAAPFPEVKFEPDQKLPPFSFV